MNTQWVVAKSPTEGWPSAGDFEQRTTPIPQPGPGQCLTRTIYLSLDPYQWLWRRSGSQQLGDVCHGRTVSVVVESRTPEFKVGDIVFNTNGWQEYGLLGEGVRVFGNPPYMFPRRLDLATHPPISTAVGVMGMLGLTAYAGMKLQLAPQAGETVVVSAASGGVGQIAGQIAKIAGARVVGIAGAAEKCKFVAESLGFDACVSYRSATFRADLAAQCPRGVDGYFESVGGAVFEAVLPLLGAGARVTLCGLVAAYGDDMSGETLQSQWLRVGRPTFEAKGIAPSQLAVGTFVREHEAAFLDEMAGWIAAGKMVYKEDAWKGLAKAPEAFAAMLRGENFGKTLVAVSDDPTLSQSSSSLSGGSRL